MDRAGISVKRFVSLQFLNLKAVCRTPSTGGSARPTQTQTNIHALNGIRTHDPSIQAGRDISCLLDRTANVVDVTFSVAQKFSS
jgi:hypothetical protein